MEYSSNTDKYKKKYNSGLAKRTKGKPFQVKLLMSRTFNTAIWILELIEDIPFEKLTTGVYFMCNDVGFKEIVRLYDSQLELAGINPDKFVMGLHSFYNAISNRIKKEQRFRELAEFFGTVMRVRANKKESVDSRIVDAYTNLILQTMEYIRPDKLDLETCVYGVSTDGELLTGPYPYAFSDVPSINFEAELVKGRKFASQAEAMDFIRSEYKKVGISVNSTEDLDFLEQTQRIHINTATSLMPFINEYTYDIVPKDTYDSLVAPLVQMTVAFNDVDSLKEQLKHRRRTLPSNGAKFVFSDPSGELNQCLLKEIFHFDSVYFLYRLDTHAGSVAGYYDTSTGFLFSITTEMENQLPYHNMNCLLLVLYASQVLDGNYLKHFSDWFHQAGMPLGVEVFGSAGKLRDVYHNDDGERRKLGQRDPEQFTHKEAAINGFIRKLPTGQSASEEARALAEQYGYELNIDETYVRPFIKQVFIRK